MSSTMRLIGTLDFRRSDGTEADIDAIATVKALDLLRLLATAGEDGVRVDFCVGQLWPAADDDKGRSSLRTAVAQVRRALGPDVVRRSGDLLALGDVVTDVAELRSRADDVDAARRAGDDAEVVELVREVEASGAGDLVVSSTSCEAVYARRDELRELRCRLLLDAAAAAHRLGWLRESLQLAQRADRLGSTEASLRALMTAWAGVGETRRAIETFERMRAQLDEAYGVQPSPQSRALYLQVVTAGDRLQLSPARLHADATAAVAGAIRLLRDREQPGGVVWLPGEPGSGRTSVARQARDLVEQDLGPLPAALRILPEVVDLDDVEVERLRAEARDHGSVLVVPIRGVAPQGLADDAVVAVGRLARSEFHELVCQLLQDRPAPALEEMLWRTTGGLARQVCVAVTQLVQDGALSWTPGAIAVAHRAPRSRRRGLSGRPSRPRRIWST